MMPTRAQALHAQAAALVPRDPGDGALYRAIQAALEELVGYKLLTILRLNGLQLLRAHSSDLQSYPAGGAKSIEHDAWLRDMLGAAQPVITPEPGLLRQRFVDHDTIFALGCGAALNLPITGVGGPGGAALTLGSLNLLHQAHWFAPEHVPLAQPFAELIGAAWSAQVARARSS